MLTSTLKLGSSVLACGTCAYGMIETQLPAIFVWSFIFPIWLLALSVLLNGFLEDRTLPHG